jgi:hypothetical protein
VLLHRPMYFGAHDMGYRLAGMPMIAEMKAGTGALTGMVLGSAA